MGEELYDKSTKKITTGIFLQQHPRAVYLFNIEMTQAVLVHRIPHHVAHWKGYKFALILAYPRPKGRLRESSFGRVNMSFK